VVIPCKNDGDVLPQIIEELSGLAMPIVEILVVDDGSCPPLADSSLFLSSPEKVRVIRHPYSMGNGAAIKTGARHAIGNYILFMDSDGQHRPEQGMKLFGRVNEGYDLVVGSRERYADQSTFLRAIGNGIYCQLASWVTGVRIRDLTSGFRLVNRERFLEILHILPNGFSYPTSSTMAFIRKGYAVAYEPILVDKRLTGKSHLNPFIDGARFFLIIIKIATLFSPLKIFSVPSVGLILSGLINYGLSFYGGDPRLTNVSAVLLTSGLLLGAIGILSEQLTNILYHENNR
jgi:glycosyltransferase involved in cell wall biosynthesis